MNVSPDMQKKLEDLVSKAKDAELQASMCFHAWGYEGKGTYHCPLCKTRYAKFPLPEVGIPDPN